MISNDVLQLAVDSKFTEFSDAIKLELKQKLANHETSQKYTSEFDHIQKMKDIFKMASGKTGE